MSIDIDLVQAQTLRSRVETVLRDAITQGKILPGTRLVERDLCEKLGVSRTSVREALRKLEAEKLVTIVPHKGPMVATLSANEALELYDLRMVLEGFAAREFARIASDEAMTEFGAAVKSLKSAAAEGDKAEVLRVKALLYGILLGNCGNSLIKEVLESLYSRITLLRSASLTHPDRLPYTIKEFEKLLKLLKARDADGAEAAARHHVANAREAALRVLAAAREEAA